MTILDRTTQTRVATLDTVVTAADGFRLAAVVHEPARPRFALVIGSAMAVPLKYYAPFAASAAEHGIAVLNFDYRGMGQSGPPSRRDARAPVTDWARLDVEAALTFARARWRLPLAYLGHSPGLHLFGLAPGSRHVRAAIGVASGSGWIGSAHSPFDFLRRLFLFGVLAPGLSAPLGRFPGRAIGIVGDVPGRQMRGWARWCLSPGYVRRAAGGAVPQGFANWRGPLLMLSFTDDAMMSRKAIALHADNFRSAKIEHRHIAPSDFGLDEINHFGFFRPAIGAAMWRPTLDWLDDAMKHATTEPDGARKPTAGRSS
jgi:predicted alpha/beta hydrolase